MAGSVSCRLVPGARMLPSSCCTVLQPACHKCGWGAGKGRQSGAWRSMHLCHWERPRPRPFLTRLNQCCPIQLLPMMQE